MKLYSKSVTFVFICILALAISAMSQTPPYEPTREVVIENTGMPNSIMQAIEADVAANGAEAAAMTKYILKRGEVYVHTEKYSPTFNTWIEAEAGDGPRPRILGVNLGGEAPRAVQPAANFVLIGVLYEGLDSDGNHTDNAPVRPKGEGLMAWVQDCVFQDHRLEVGRTDGAYQSHFWYDNIFTNNFQNNRWIKGNVFYLKNLPEDTLVVKNNTFYNNTTQIFRGTKAGYKYIDFSQNTVYNMGGLMDFYMYQNNGAIDAIIDFGVTQNAVCKDNLLVNVGVFGYRPSEADSLFVIHVDMTDSTETVDISHNNFWRDPEFATLNPDSVEIFKLFSPELEAMYGENGENANFISEAVAFVNAPSSQDFKDAVTLYFSSSTAFLEQLSFPNQPEDPTAVNFGYTAGLSPTASSTGGPLGDARWHGSVTVGVADKTPASVESFTLHGNYPNPFNPSTTIRFDLHNQANVQVKVMNVRGQVVYETAETAMTAGSNAINIDASDWTSGVYIYQVIAKENQATTMASGRMLLMK